MAFQKKILERTYKQKCPHDLMHCHSRDLAGSEPLLPHRHVGAFDHNVQDKKAEFRVLPFW